MLVEIDEQDATAARSRCEATLAVLKTARRQKPILLHGFDSTVWTFVERAAAARFSTRVGLEDGCHLPDGRIAPDNAALVAAAIALILREAT